MCGIDGLVANRATVTPAVVTDRLRRAGVAQAHRGPDGAGQVLEGVNDWWVGLGHQRLAIIDLSERAAQPMRSAAGQDVLSYNGEVYNYAALRAALAREGVEFISDSDTEVVAAALRLWGVERALSSFNGMWALAWLDGRAGRLILARDRLGIKPLYLDTEQGQLAFASEIKGLLAMSGRRYALNLEAVSAYLQQALIDYTPRTFFAGVESLPAGCYASVDLRAPHLRVEVVRYWAPTTSARAAPAGADELQDEVRSLFFDAVDRRLRADVRVGVLLSGGLDSSAIAAAAARNDSELTLLTATSTDDRFDESSHAELVARHLGQELRKVPVDLGPEEAFDLLERVTWHHDEPLGSFTAVAHYLLMQAAADLGVGVVLSGQGADELLCGYKKYLGFQLQDLLRSGRPLEALRHVGGALRQGTLLRQFSLAEARRYLPGVRATAGSDLGAALLGEAASRTAAPGGDGVTGLSLGLPRGMSMQERQALDLTSFSVPQLTHYEDRMSMAHGREVRLPFLDYRLVEELLPLDASLKLRDGWTKHLFRQALAPYLPLETTWRRDKQGFTLPQGEWLREALRPRALELLRPDALVFRHGLLRRAPLLATYDRFAAQGERRSGIWYRQIFSRLALEVWLRRFQEHLSLGEEFGETTRLTSPSLRAPLPVAAGGGHA